MKYKRSRSPIELFIVQWIHSGERSERSRFPLWDLVLINFACGEIAIRYRTFCKLYSFWDRQGSYDTLLQWCIIRKSIKVEFDSKWESPRWPSIPNSYRPAGPNFAGTYVISVTRRNFYVFHPRSVFYFSKSDIIPTYFSFFVVGKRGLNKVLCLGYKFHVQTNEHLLW